VKLTLKLTTLGLLIAALLAACQGAAPQATTAPPALSPAASPAPGESTPAAAGQPTAYPLPTAPPQAEVPESVQLTAYPAPAGQPAQPGLSCASPASLTPALTEGPYFKAGSPERTSLLEPGMPGTRLVLTGYVLTADCQPVAGALLEFWQADANGNYDNTGYTLRGHQFSDAAGRYQLETVIPGLYPGRTEHIHFKVQAPNGPVLTSQLFFPEVAANQSDSIFDPSLVLALQPSADGYTAAFNFVVAVK
jgi:protocatechuate 3,4-dioxygenase beta subunit